jgi:hypothetical protein
MGSGRSYNVLKLVNNILQPTKLQLVKLIYKLNKNTKLSLTEHNKARQLRNKRLMTVKKYSTTFSTNPSFVYNTSTETKYIFPFYLSNP